METPSYDQNVVILVSHGRHIVTFLAATELTGGYGSTNIIEDISLSVERGQIAVIVGPNGAGKSTAMKAIFGMITLRSGYICFKDKDISRLPPQKRVANGMAFVPQTRNIFPALTIAENLSMGAYLREDNITASIQQIYELFPILGERQNQLAGELSGGQRQQVALGRALMTSPELLMLDEPTAGVSPVVMDEVMERIMEIAGTGVAVMMVEQNARHALQIADIGYVLVQGRNRFTGSGPDLLANREVRTSFLGG